MGHGRPPDNRHVAAACIHVKHLEKGPTPEMVRAVELAKERIKHIVEVDPYEFERRRRRAFGARDSASASG